MSFIQRLRAEYPDYVKSCEEDALSLTGIEFHGLDSQGRPSLDFSFGEGSDWTFGRIVQISEMYNLIAGGLSKYFMLLIELYRDEPLHLHQQYLNALEISRWVNLTASDRHLAEEEGDRLLKDILKELAVQEASVTDYWLFRKFVHDLFPYEKGAERSLKRLIREMAYMILDRRKRDVTFARYINGEIAVRTDIGTACQPPFLIGLHSIFSQRLDNFQVGFFEYMRGWLRSRHFKRWDRLASHWRSEDQYNSNLFQLAFAPSGSGKTTSAFMALTQEYGYYMMSALASDVRLTLMESKISGVSRDTREISRLFYCVHRLVTNTAFYYGMVLHYRCVQWWQCIFQTRDLILRLFRKALSSQSSPKLWLSFQLDCSEWDPFLQVFRVASLFDLKSNLSLSRKQLPDIRRQDVRWAFVDEAQDDLRFALGSENLLGACMAAMSSWDTAQDDFIYFRQVVFAGTSLNILEALETREHVLKHGIFWGDFKGKVWQKDSCNIANRFPLVTNRENAEAVLKSFGIANATKAAEKSDLLQGRIRWTAMYAERIMKMMKEPTELQGDVSNGKHQELLGRSYLENGRDLDFDRLAEETFNEITYDLRARLTALRDQGDNADLLEKLLEAAVSADILGRDHIFYDKRDLQLVEQGFAIVDSWMNRLEDRLQHYFTFVGRVESHLTARLKPHQQFEDAAASVLVEVDKEGCTIEGCTIGKLTDKMLAHGFSVVDCTMAELVTEMENDRFTIVSRSSTQLTAEPPEDYTVFESLTKEMVQNGFVIWGDNRRSQLQGLKLKSLEYDQKTDYWTFAKARKDIKLDESEVKKIEELLKCFILMNEWNDQLMGSPPNDRTFEYCHGTSRLREFWKGQLGGQIFDMEHISGIWFQATPKKIMESGEQEKIAKKREAIARTREATVAALGGNGFKILSSTKVEFEEILKGSITIRNDSKDALKAKLAERVVIDAIILFSISDNSLHESLMRVVRSVSSRDDLGHFAENLLAVQLRQYLSQPVRNDLLPSENNDSFQNEWTGKQSQILARLARAMNCKRRELGSLNDYALSIGSQTIKTFDAWDSWVSGFSAWLRAIQDRQKPCASFLIPHNDFGPDLVFALRKKTGNGDEIVLCSIQMKLGPGSLDGVNKSSITWACGDRNPGTNEADKAKVQREKLKDLIKMMEAQETALREMTYTTNNNHDTTNLYSEMWGIANERLKNMKVRAGWSRDLSEAKTLLDSPFWKNQVKLSLLITTNAQEGGQLQRERPKLCNCNRKRASVCDQDREYYSLVQASDTRTFFGAPFETTLAVLER